MKLHLPLPLRGALLATMVSLTLAYGDITVQIGDESGKTMGDIKETIDKDVTITIGNESAFIGQKVRLKGKTTITLNEKGELALEGIVQGDESLITVGNGGILTFRWGAFAYDGGSGQSGSGKIEVQQGGKVNCAFGSIGYNNAGADVADKKTGIVLDGGTWNSSTGSCTVAQGFGNDKKGEVSIRISNNGTFTAGKGVQMAVGNQQGTGVLHLDVQKGTFTQDGSSIGVTDGTGHYDVDITVEGDQAVYKMTDGYIGKSTGDVSGSADQNTIDITVQDNGQFQMEGGEIGLAAGDTAKVTVGANGTFTQSGGINRADITLSGGTYTLSKGTVGGTVTVNSGTYNQSGGIVNGTISVTGGEYKQTAGTVNGNIAVSGNGIYDLAGGSKLNENVQITVSGGTLNVKGATGTKMNLTMTGGTTDVSTGDITEGSTLTLESGNANLLLSAADASITGSTITVGSDTTLTQSAGEIIGSTLDITGTFTMNGGSVKGSGSKLTVKSGGSVTQGGGATVEGTEIVLEGGSYTQEGDITGGSITLKTGDSEYTQKGSITDGQITLEDGTYTLEGTLTNTKVTQTGGVFNQNATVQGNVDVSAGTYNQNQSVGGSVHVSGAASYNQEAEIVGSVTLSGADSSFTQDNEVQGDVMVNDGAYALHSDGTITGKVTMQGGTFKADGSINAGVLVEGGTFTQGSGTIEGEVMVSGSGAVFTQESSDSTGAIQGKVRVEEGGAFTLKENSSTVSGGVSISGDGSSFTLEGGTIHGEVYVNGGTFSQSGGALTDTLTLNSGTFTLSGGSMNNAMVSDGSLLIDGGSATVSGTIAVTYRAKGGVQQSNGSVSKLELLGGTYTATGGTIGSVEMRGGNYFGGTFALDGATVESDVSVKGVRCTFTLQSGTVKGAVNVSGGNVTQSGGTVASGSLDNGNWTLNNATITDSLTLSNGTFTQTGTNSSVGSVLQSGGTYTAQGGEIADNVTITGGTFTQKGSAVAGAVSVSGANSSFTLENGTVAGEVNVSGGKVTQSGGTIASGSLENNGSWTLDNASISGNVTLSSGNFTQKGPRSSVGGVQQGGGTYTTQGGKIAGDVTITGGTFNQGGATTVSGNVSVDGVGSSFTLESGTVGGMVNVSGGSITQRGGSVASGTLNDGGNWVLNGSNASISGSLTLGDGFFSQVGSSSSVGSVRQSGGNYNAQSGSIFENVDITKGTFTLSGTAVSGDVSVDGKDSALLLNAGLVKSKVSVSGGSGVTQNGSTVVGSGSLNNGSWELSGSDASITGSLFLDGDSTFEQSGANSSVGSVVQNGGNYNARGGIIAGDVVLSGGTFTQSGTAVSGGVSVEGEHATFSLESGSVAGAVSVSSGGTVTQKGGSVGSGSLNGGSWTLSGENASVTGSLSLNDGTFEQKGGSVGSGSLNGGTWNLSGENASVDGSISLSSGIFDQTGVGSSVNSGILNDGTWNLSGENASVTGSLSLNGGTFTQTGANSSVGSVVQSGGNYNARGGRIAENVTITGGTFTQSGANVSGTITVDGKGSEYLYNGGTLQSVTVHNGGSMSAQGSVNAKGGIVLDGGTLTLGTGGSIGAGTEVSMSGTDTSIDFGGQSSGGNITLHAGELQNAGSFGGNLYVNTEQASTNLGGVKGDYLKGLSLSTEGAIVTGIADGSIQLSGTSNSVHVGKDNVGGGPTAIVQFDDGTNGTLGFENDGQMVLNFAASLLHGENKDPDHVQITVQLTNGNISGMTTPEELEQHFRLEKGLSIPDGAEWSVDGGVLSIEVQVNGIIFASDYKDKGGVAMGSDFKNHEKVYLDDNLTLKTEGGEVTLKQLSGDGVGEDAKTPYKLTIEGSGTVNLENSGGTVGDTVLVGSIESTNKDLTLAKTGDSSLTVTGGNLNLAGTLDVQKGKLVLEGNENQVGVLQLGGDTTLELGAEGVLTVTGDSTLGAGTLTGAGTLVLRGTTSLNEGLSLSVGTLEIAEGGNVTGNTNITGNVLVSGGTLNVASGDITGNVDVSAGSFQGGNGVITGHVDVSGNGKFTGGAGAIGGGVSVSDQGSFTAGSGTIIGNVDVSGGSFTAVGDIGGNVNVSGGAFTGGAGIIDGSVNVSGKGSFSAGTGTIVGNVELTGGKFTSSTADGTIDGNVSVSDGEFLANAEHIVGHVNVSGGSFTGGAGAIDGGVSVSGGDFRAGAGKITGNVDVSAGTFQGGVGEINGHVTVSGTGEFTGGAGILGGDVRVSDQGSFTAGAGTITGNVELLGGSFTGGEGIIDGGVNVSGGDFKAGKGAISGHIDVSGGSFTGGVGTIDGGVSVSDQGSFTAGTGKITGNVELSGGSFSGVDGGEINGDVRVNDQGSFSMGTGKVTGNVELSGGSFIGNGGVITGNVGMIGGTFTSQGSAINGNVEVGGGEFHGEKTNITGNVGVSDGKFIGGEGTIGGGVTVSSAKGSFTSGNISISGNVNVTAGSFTGGTKNIGGVVSVSGGAFSAGKGAISGHVDVSGGSFSGGDGAINSGVTVSGGAFTAGKGAVSGHVDVLGTGKFTGGAGTIGGGVSISDKGSFTAGSGAITGNVELSGGSFSGNKERGEIKGDVKVSAGEFRENAEHITGLVDVSGGSFVGGSGAIGGGVNVSGGSFSAGSGTITGNVRVSGGKFTGGTGNIDGNVEIASVDSFSGGSGTITGAVLLDAADVKLDQTGYTITGKLILSGDNTSASFADGCGVIGAQADHSSDTVPSDTNIQLSGTGSSVVFTSKNKHEGSISMTGVGCTLDLGGAALGSKSSIYMERGSLKNAGNYEGNVFIDLRDAHDEVDLAGLRADRISDLHVHGNQGVNFTNLGAGTLTFSGNANIVVVGSQSVSGDALTGQGGTTSVFDFAEGADGHIAFADGGALTLQLANELYYELANGQLIIHLSDVGFADVNGDLLEYVRQHFHLRTGDGLTLDGYEISGPTTAGEGGIDIVLDVATDNRWEASDEGSSGSVSSDAFEGFSKVDFNQDTTVNSTGEGAQSTLRQLEGKGNMTLNAGQGQDMTVTFLNESLSVDGMEMFGDTTYEGNITSPGDGKVNLVKDGNAGLSLSGNVAINGGLTVNNGRLDLNGQSNSVGSLSMSSAENTNPELAVNGSLSVKEESSLDSGTLSGSGEIVVEKGLTLGENLQLGDIAPAMKVQKDATLSIESTDGTTLGGLSGEGNVSVTQAQELVLKGDQPKETPDAFSGKINFGKGSGTLRMDGYVNQKFDGVQAQNVTLDALSADGSSHTHSSLSFAGNNTFQALKAGGAVDVRGHLSTTGHMEFSDTSRLTLHVDLASPQSPLLSSSGNLSLRCAQLLVDLTGQANPTGDLSVVLAEGLSILGEDGTAYAPGTRLENVVFSGLSSFEFYLTVEGEAAPDVALAAADGVDVPETSGKQQLVLHGTPIPAGEDPNPDPNNPDPNNPAPNPRPEPLLPEGLSHNATAGFEFLANASGSGILAKVLETFDTYRTSGDVAVASRIATAVAGSTVTAISSAVDDGLRDHLLRMRGYAQLPDINVDEGKKNYHFWVTPEVNFAKVDADGDESGYELDSWGGNIGVDMKVLNEGSRVGLALSASYGDLDADAADSASGSIDSYYLSLYSHIRTGKWLHTGILALGTHSADLDRTVDYATSVYRTNGSTDAFSAGLFYELAYDLKLNKDGNQLLQPHVQMMLRHTAVSGWDEGAPDGLGLNVDDSDATTFTLGVGTRWVSLWDTGAVNRSVRTELGVTIAQDFGDTQPESDVALRANPGFRRTVRGSEAGNTSVQLSAGVAVPVSNTVQVFLNAGSTLRSDSSTWSIGLGARADF